jgi:hypothetical protein
MGAGCANQGSNIANFLEKFNANRANWLVKNQRSSGEML